MGRRVHFILLFNYYYSILNGALPIAYNARTMRGEKKTWVTVACLISNLFSIAVVPPLFIHKMMHLSWVDSPGLRDVVFLITNILKFMAVMVTLGLNWRNRDEMVDGVNRYLQLQKNYILKFKNSEVRNFESAIVLKFLTSLTSEIFLWLLYMNMFWKNSNYMDLLMVTIVTFFFNILAQVINRAYFVIVNVNLMLGNLHDELVSILSAVDRLQLELPRQPTFGKQCRRLSDRLKNLVVIYSKLIRATNFLIKQHQLQGLVILLNMYLTDVATLYNTYTFITRDSQLLSTFDLIIMTLTAIFYYTDLLVFVKNMLLMYETYEKSLSLLFHRTNFSQLPAPLDRSFEQLYFQLSMDSLDSSVCGLFIFNKSMGFAVGASVLQHSIFLIQHDMGWLRSKKSI